MKKVIYIVGIIALISAIMVIPVSAMTYYIHPDDPKNTVWHIMRDQASPGDTLFFYNGTYSIYGVLGTQYIDVENVTWKGEGADVVTLDLGGGIFIHIEKSGCVLDGFKIVNSDIGIEVTANSPNCIIRNCVFDGVSGGEGLMLLADNLTFENNVVSDSTAGASCAAKLTGNSSRVANNTFINSAGSWCALYVRLGADFCTVVNNTFINSAGSRALTLREVKNCIVVNNTFIDNTGDGIRIWKASATDNIITRNTITSNGGIIRLRDAGEGNKIYLNDFVDNTKSVTYSGTPPAVTYWNSTEEIEYVYSGSTYTNYLGNYWSPQYTGTDADSDGIGDTAYPIPGSATDKDYRPLMAGFENYPELSKPDLDLIPTAITAPALFAGEPNTITATIENIGTVDAGSFNVSLSADGNIVDTATVDSLNAGMITNVSFQWTPASAGDYELCVVADCDGSVTELDETNNEMCIEVEIKPDLTTTEITTPELLLLNQPSVINASIANVGNADAGSFNVSLSADGTVVDTANVESLGIGNTTNVSFQWTPSSVGEVNLCVAADSDGSVDELNETNNDKCVVVTVVAPDLVPTAMAPDAFFPGKPNTITATIENIGDADAGSFNVALSVDGTEVDTASVASLSDGASTEVSFSWMAAVGNHKLCVLADTDSEVDESDETNNGLCKDVTVYPNTVYLVPKDSGAPYCCEAEVEVWVEAEDGFQGGQINLAYSLDCANVTGVEFNPVWDFDSATWWDTYEGYTRISFAKREGMVNGDVWIGNLMIQCTSEDIDTLCSTSLSYATTTKLVNDFGTEVKANWIEGTFGCRIPAEVTIIKPETLNLGSQGNFTAFVTLPEGYDVADIDVSTVECEGAPVVESEIVHGGDTLMVKFNRQKLVGVPTGDAVTMRVTGKMQTGKIFVGRDTICVIKEGQ